MTATTRPRTNGKVPAEEAAPTKAQAAQATAQERISQAGLTGTPLLEIARVDLETMLVPIIGTSPLLMHNWSQKAKLQMLATQQGQKKMKEARDPQAEYESSFYRTADGFGFPSIGFKSATVDANRFYGKSVTKVGLRQFLFFKGRFTTYDSQALFPIIGEPRMREDMVTVGISGTDLRFRAEFPEWRSELTVTYVRSSLTRDSVLALINAGGFGVGIGDWRPEKGGDFGNYEIDTDRELTVLNR